MGWRARGAAIVAEDFHTLILPLDRPSIFLNLTKGVEIHAGPLGGGEGNGLLLDALGDPTPTEAVVVPVRVRGKVVAFLWLDQGADGVAGISIPLVQEVARLAGPRHRDPGPAAEGAGRRPLDRDRALGLGWRG